MARSYAAGRAHVRQQNEDARRAAFLLELKPEQIAFLSPLPSEFLAQFMAVKDSHFTWWNYERRIAADSLVASVPKLNIEQP